MQTNKQLPAAGVWIDRIDPSKEEIEKIFQEHDFHELDREAILEEHQYARLDPYENYLFLVLHFPKYNTKTERYIQNELDIFVGKDFLITFRYYPSTTMRHLYAQYENRKDTADDDHNDPAFLLYDIIEGFLDKTMNMLDRFTKDLRVLERDLFSSPSRDTIRSLMIKKRNIIALKHMMRPQIPVLRQTENYMKGRFSEEVENYFENLEDKLDKIFSEIQIIEENIESMEDTMKSIFDLDTNIIIKYLTIFSAFMLPLTLATSFFGMNVEEWHFNNTLIWLTLIITTVVFTIVMYFFFFKKHD